MTLFNVQLLKIHKQMKTLFKFCYCLIALSLPWNAAAPAECSQSVSLNRIGDKLYEVLEEAGQMEVRLSENMAFCWLMPKWIRNRLIRQFRRSVSLQINPTVSGKHSHRWRPCCLGNKVFPGIIRFRGAWNCRKESYYQEETDSLHPGMIRRWHHISLLWPSAANGSVCWLKKSRALVLWTGHTTGDMVSVSRMTGLPLLVIRHSGAYSADPFL